MVSTNESMPSDLEGNSFVTFLKKLPLNAYFHIVLFFLAVIRNQNLMVLKVLMVLNKALIKHHY